MTDAFIIDICKVDFKNNNCEIK